MQRRFHVSLGGARLSLTQTRRITTVRYTACPHARSATLSWSFASAQRRQYGHDGRGGQQQMPMGGYYPPPPPPGYGAGYGGMPPQQQQYAAPNGGGQPMPMHHHQPDIGTKDRPMVVQTAHQPPSMWSRLWMVMFMMIGISAALHILEEIEMRSSEQGGAGPGGGPGGKGGPGGMGGGRGLSGMFGSQEVKPVDLESQVVSFGDVKGCDEAKGELQEIVMFLKDPKKFVALGGRLPKGALLVGPPGCGKTMLAKAIAKEAGVKFFYSAGSEFDEMFVGVGSRRVRELFAAAKANSPALVFIDEIDALGGKRSNKDHAYSRMTLNQLLAEMDGFQPNDEVIVIAATNTPDTLDKALTRPGRFDTTIAVDPPDLKGRTEILDTYLAKIKRDDSFQAVDIARGTAGFTGAELSNIVNVAAIRAAVLDKLAVTQSEIEYAKDRVMMGAENKTKVIPLEEKRVTAYHEGGHALVAMLLEDQGCDPVHKATIVPRGSGIMGLVQQQPTKDRYSQSRKQCLNRLKVCLAGRVAEEMLLGEDDVTTGAASDFHQATSMARAMVRRFGFSGDLGMIDYESADTNEGAMMSDSTKHRIEEEVRTIVHTSYVQAKDMLVKHRPQLDLIAKELLAQETLSGDDLKKIVKGEKLPGAGSKAGSVSKTAPSAPPPRPSGGQAVPLPTIPDKAGA